MLQRKGELGLIMHEERQLGIYSCIAASTATKYSCTDAHLSYEKIARG